MSCETYKWVRGGSGCANCGDPLLSHPTVYNPTLGGYVTPDKFPWRDARSWVDASKNIASNKYIYGDPIKKSWALKNSVVTFKRYDLTYTNVIIGTRFKDSGEENADMKWTVLRREDAASHLDKAGKIR